MTEAAIDRLLREAPERDELLDEYRGDLAELAGRRRAVGRGLDARTKSAAEKRADARFAAILLEVEQELPGRERARRSSPARRRLVAIGVLAVASLATASVIAAAVGGDDGSPAPAVAGLGPAASLNSLELGVLAKAADRAQARELAAERARAAARRERRLAAAKAEAKAERAAAAEAASTADETTTTATTTTPETTTAAPAAAPTPAPEPAPTPAPAPEPAPAPSGGGSDCFTFEC